MTYSRKNNPTHCDKQDRYAPIANTEADALGFTEAAVFIAKTIMGSDQAASWVVGIDGVWGDGKSSLINLVQQNLFSAERTWRPPIVIRFEPWLSGDTNELVANFFRQLANAFDKVNQAQFPIHSWNRWRLIWLKLQLSGSLSIFSTLISGSGLLTAIASLNVFMGLVTGIVRLFSGKPTLEVQKVKAQKLISKLLEANKQLRLIVIVDDLDRLEPGEALEVIRLVKAVANFSGVTYLLAYDKNVLANAIKESSKVDDGIAYLEKIVQFEFKVPIPGPFRLRNFFRRKLQTEFPDAADWNSPRASVVLDVWAGRLLKTPRDVIKVFEAIRIIWKDLYTYKADLIDLIWLEMLKEKASTGEKNLYSWVIGYVRSIEALAIGGQVSQKRKSQNELEEILGQLGWKKPSDERKREFDFHHLDELLVGCSKGFFSSRKSLSDDDDLWIFQVDYNGDEIRKAASECRFSSPWHWALYVAFRQSENALLDDVWNRMRELAHSENALLTDAIKSIMQTSHPSQDRDTIGDQFLERVEADCGQTSPNIALFWYKAVIDTADDTYRRSATSWFGLNRHAGSLVVRLTRSVLSTLPKEKRLETITEVFSHGKSIWALSEIYRDQLHHFAPGHSERNAPFFTKEEFDAAQSIVRERLSSIDVNTLISTPDAWNTLYAAHNALEEEAARAWFSKRISTDLSLVSVLEALQTIQSSAQVKPGVPAKWIADFANVEEIMSRLRRIANTNTELAPRAENILRNWWAGT